MAEAESVADLTDGDSFPGARRGARVGAEAEGAKALIKAHKERNVDVQLVLDGSDEGNNAVKLLRAALPAGRLAIVPEPDRPSAEGPQQQRDRAR